MIREKILITGASGQLGSVLTDSLQEKWGVDNVIATDLRENSEFTGRFETLDATDYDAIVDLISENKITQIYHLAAILSANGEKAPLQTWNINMKTLFNVLEASRLHNIKKVFFPSSIAVFGPNVESNNTPQFSNLTPTTVYGISKGAGENWANYYFKKYGLDVRSLRYPGVIGYQSLPGGGTTDYAVDIYHKAVKEESFECFINESTELPMIFMDDAIRATIELMDAPSENIKIRTSYNLAGMSFTPEQIFNSIKKIYPDFTISYKPDFRQHIASSWPGSIDDSNARNDWNWKPKFDLDSMSQIMIEKLKVHYHSLTI
ncbi:NAD-dependent epimerase/dehydratase family protein [Tenacibaculum sp. ZS6-P6]|uniref:NAD-dependent epimerase/dehydratase family protein n=1 Tax=Tenacibaculum sp. ZS6-P6 TaxID=3447503 RepID=UPI003F968C54